MGDQGGRLQLQLLSYDELFRPSREDSAKTIQKFRGLQRQNTLKGETRAKNELLTVLKQQRVLVDDRAIHFVAEARGKGRADARNSVFKLAQRYKVLPDTENVTKIRQLFGPVREGDSGDEDWEPSFRRLPTSLKTTRAQKLMNDDERDILLKEINKIEDESSALGDNVVTKEEVQEDPEYMIGRAIDNTTAGAGLPPAHGKEEHGDEHESESDEDEEDDHFDAEDLKALNDMQKEFISDNLIAWMKDIRKAYESGVKLVKVNALGYKFIRILIIKDMLFFTNRALMKNINDARRRLGEVMHVLPSVRRTRETFVALVLSIRQPHTQSKVKVERQVAITEVQDVQLGRESKEFVALAKLVEEGKEPADNNPTATLCAVVKLPKNRSLSLVFLDEDQRNGFVFYLRVISKKAKSAAAELGDA